MLIWCFLLMLIGKWSHSFMFWVLKERSRTWLGSVELELQHHLQTDSFLESFPPLTYEEYWHLFQKHMYLQKYMTTWFKCDHTHTSVLLGERVSSSTMNNLASKSLLLWYSSSYCLERVSSYNKSKADGHKHYFNSDLGRKLYFMSFS